MQRLTLNDVVEATVSKDFVLEETASEVLMEGPPARPTLPALKTRVKPRSKPVEISDGLEVLQELADRVKGIKPTRRPAPARVSKPEVFERARELFD